MFWSITMLSLMCSCGPARIIIHFIYKLIIRKYRINPIFFLFPSVMWHLSTTLNTLVCLSRHYFPEPNQKALTHLLTHKEFQSASFRRSPFPLMVIISSKVSSTSLDWGIHTNHITLHRHISHCFLLGCIVFVHKRLVVRWHIICCSERACLPTFLFLWGLPYCSVQL